MTLRRLTSSVLNVLTYVIVGIAFLAIAAYFFGVLTGIADEEGWTVNMLIGPGPHRALVASIQIALKS